MAEKVGRPLKFKSVEELQQKIDEYFALCKQEGLPFTVSGLSDHLDVDRKTLINYEDKEEFFHTIKRAKTKIERYLEEQSLLNKLNPTISIFNLKNNFGWKDKTEVEQKTEHSGGITVTLEGELEEWAK